MEVFKIREVENFWANRSRTRTWRGIYQDHENDSHKIRHKFFKRLRHIELATNTSSSEKFGSIHAEPGASQVNIHLSRDDESEDVMTVDSSRTGEQLCHCDARFGGDG